MRVALRRRCFALLLVPAIALMTSRAPAAGCTWTISPPFDTVQLRSSTRLTVKADSGTGPSPRLIASNGAIIAGDVVRFVTTGSKLIRAHGQPCSDGLAAFLVTAPPIDGENERYVEVTIPGNDRYALQLQDEYTVGGIFRFYAELNYVHRANTVQFVEMRNGVRTDPARTYIAFGILQSGDDRHSGTDIGIGLERSPELFYPGRASWFGSFFYYPAAANITSSVDARRYYYVKEEVGIAIVPQPYTRTFVALRIEGESAIYRGSPPASLSRTSIAISLGERI